MDTFLVILEGKVVDQYTSLQAARQHVQDKLAGYAPNGLTYQIAQVVATNKAIRVWNEP